VNPLWCPHGARRFRELVDGDVLEDSRVWRAVPGFMCQMGIPGDPAVAREWRERRIPDDPRNEAVTNERGTLSFATSGLGRSSQFFINFADNKQLDEQGFPPFGRIVEDDIAVLGVIYQGYGDGPPNGQGPDQQLIRSEGNPYLEREFPKLTYIRTAKVVELDGYGAEGYGASDNEPFENSEVVLAISDEEREV
jgi:peptidyl-prolyl cis-trans isomerase A (cyclophilin A)